MTLSEKITITATEVAFFLLLSVTVVSKQKNENTEFHGTFISFKGFLYSKQRSLIFLLFGSRSAVLYLHVWVKS